jgi:thiol-disulfide isomerase/thioredoxin
MAKRAYRKRKKEAGKARRQQVALPPPTFLEVHWKTLALMATMLVIVVVGAYAVTQIETDDGDGNGDENGDDPPPVSTAPGFLIHDIDGLPLSLDDNRGRVVVLDLFATWCGPCETQMSELNQLRAHFPEEEVVIMSIDVDSEETTEQVREFKLKYNANWAFARDTDGVGTKYDARSIPTLAIIDRDGNLSWKDSGVTTFAELRQRIEPLLD